MQESEFYKSKLSLPQKKIYNIIYKGLVNHRESIYVYSTNIDSLNKIIEAIIYDNPKIYYVNGIEYSINKVQNYTNINIQYSYSLLDIKKYNLKINEIIQNFLIITKNKSIYDKILIIHDLFCKNIIYYENGEESHNIIGVFINKKAVCEGIAKAVKVIFDSLNIRNCLAFGKALSPNIKNSWENHSWNKVMIEGKWYNIDITFDNTISRVSRFIRHDYFLLSDNSISKEHFDDYEYGFTCDSDELSYYSFHNLVMYTQQMLQIYVKQMLINRINCFEFCIPMTSDANQVYRKVIKIIENALQELNCSKKFNVFYNNYLLIFTICFE